MLHMTFRYWICIDCLVKVVFKKCYLESKTLPIINRYPINKEKTFREKTKIKQFSLLKNQLMVYQNK